MLQSKCLICESNNIRRMEGYHSPQLLKCGHCGFVFCEEVPSVDALTSYYATYGAEHYLSPITTARYNEWLDKFEKYRNTGNILDIGCGSGFFLAEAKKRGWNVFGTEYSDVHVERCRSTGINMWKGGVEAFMFPGIEFDIITSIEVIEHINNPLHEMQIISSKLRSGGLFYCTTPNFNALSRFLLGPKYNIISYPEHLSYYTRSTLNKLCAGFQLKKLKSETTGISITRFNQSNGKTDQAVISATSDDELIRNRIEGSALLRLLKRLVNSLLQITGLGYSLKAWFIKQG